MNFYLCSKFENITRQPIKEVEINRPEQIWVTNITYLRTKGKTYYLHFITDTYSKKIVGYRLLENLIVTYILKALNMVVINKEYNNSLIHHRDRNL